MTCNFCGSTLEDNESECPYCGHKVKTANTAPADNSAKNFAADMAARFSPKNRAANGASAKQKRTSSRAGLSGSPKFTSALSGIVENSRVLLAIILAVFFIFLMITMFTAVSAKNQVSDMYQDMLSQFYQMQSTNAMLSSQIEKLNAAASAPSGGGNTVPKASTTITVTKQPTDCATYIGRTGNIPIFSVNATGRNLAFNWQKYNDSTGKWENIVFDTDSNNATYGVHLYNNISSDQGASELSAHDVTAAAYGTYRCAISDSNGQIASDTVVLSERPKD